MDIQLQELIAKDQIRELAMLYSRGVDRKDGQLLRSLYTEDATDTHGDTFDGTANDYVDFLESCFPYMRYSGHHICNHLISVNGNEAQGEVYALAYHIIPDGQDDWLEDFMCVRYIDQYRKESDDRWRFSRRVVSYDLRSRRAAHESNREPSPEDPSYDVLSDSLFQRGSRA